MNMENVILTIAIPTYNRSGYLKQNLESFVPQCCKYKENVRIVVSDNASSDNTREVVEYYVNSFPEIVSYVRNDNNIGVQQNFSRCVELSNSKYVFLMGDDDIVCPNFLSIIMPYLTEDTEYGIIHWGRLVGDADCNNNKIHNPYYNQLIEKSSVSEFIKSTLSSTNFLSCCIFNKQCWLLGETCEEKEMLGYGYYARFMSGAIELNAPCIHYFFPLVLMRNPSRVWSKNWPIYFWYEMFVIFKSIDKRIPGVYDLWVMRTRDKHFYDRSSVLLLMYAAPSYYRSYAPTIVETLTGKEKLLFRLVMLKPKIYLIERIYHAFLIAVYRLFY